MTVDDRGHDEADVVRYRTAVAMPELDPYDPAFRERTEWDVYQGLRETAPVAWVPQGKEWWFTGYEACRAAFQDWETFSNDLTLPEGVGPLLVAEKFLGIPVYVDPPEHRQWKRLLDPLFAPNEMAALEDDIRGYAAELLDPLRDRTECDLVTEFAMPFPTMIFCRLMGLPVEDHAMVMWWKDAYLNGRSTYVAARCDPADRDANGVLGEKAVVELKRRALAETKAYLADIFEQRRHEPRDDLMTKFLTLRWEGRPLTQDELLRISHNLFLGGLDTVTGVLSLVIRTLAERPADRQALIALMDDPRAFGIAVEELHRHQSIVPMPRRVTRTCPFSGVQLEENDIVALHTPSANRDPGRFEEPDTLRLDRHPNPHLGYGLGRHRCLGIHLARRELRIGLQELLSRFPAYRLAPDTTPEVNTGGLRGLFSLPVILE
jgi:cytochrome P450